MLCPYCKTKEIKKNNKTCGSKECLGVARTVHLKGKKRPEHAALMKKYAKEGRLDAWVKLTNKDINSLDFKRTSLKNAGVDDVDSMSDEQVNIEHNHLKSKRMKSRSSMEARIRTVIEKYRDEEEFKASLLAEVDTSTLSGLDMESIKQLRSIALSVVSTVAMRNNPEMGSSKSSKREWLNNLQYHVRGKDRVYCKSSYEKNFILQFENNALLWDYEAIAVRTDTGIYIPDFVVLIGQQLYMIEVKGYMPDYDSYLKKKMQFAIDYCNQNDIKFVYVKEPVLDLAKLDAYLVD